MIRCVNINKSFGKKVVLNAFSYHFHSQGIQTITGPSGCGKTTLARIIMGLEKPDSGVVEGQRALRFSAAFPEDRLIPTMTALENVNYPLRGSQSSARDLLEMLRLENSIHQYPHELSSGMKQRVSLARALAYDGDILVLDEPFRGFDDELKQYVLSLLMERSQKMPVIIFSHEVSLLQKVSATFLRLDYYTNGSEELTS